MYADLSGRAFHEETINLNRRNKRLPAKHKQEHYLAMVGLSHKYLCLIKRHPMNNHGNLNAP